MGSKEICPKLSSGSPIKIWPVLPSYQDLIEIILKIMPNSLLIEYPFP